MFYDLKLSSSEQDSHLLGGPFNIILSRLDLILFFELLIDMTHSPPLLSNGEHYRDGPAGAAGDFLFSLPFPPLLAVRVL
jgi:hypothetical protein